MSDIIPTTFWDYAIRHRRLETILMSGLCKTEVGIINKLLETINTTERENQKIYI